MNDWMCSLIVSSVVPSRVWELTRRSTFVKSQLWSDELSVRFQFYSPIPQKHQLEPASAWKKGNQSQTWTSAWKMLSSNVKNVQLVVNGLQHAKPPVWTWILSWSSFPTHWSSECEHSGQVSQNSEINGVHVCWCGLIGWKWAQLPI